MPIPSFELKVLRNERKTRIAPAGELDIATAPTPRPSPGPSSCSTCAS
jgi:hypothetical protein